MHFVECLLFCMLAFASVCIHTYRHTYLLTNVQMEGCSGISRPRSAAYTNILSGSRWDLSGSWDRDGFLWTGDSHSQHSCAHLLLAFSLLTSSHSSRPLTYFHDVMKCKNASTQTNRSEIRKTGKNPNVNSSNADVTDVSCVPLQTIAFRIHIPPLFRSQLLRWIMGDTVSYRNKWDSVTVWLWQAAERWKTTQSDEIIEELVDCIGTNDQM